MDITYIDRFIQTGKKETMSLKNFYDTILIGDSAEGDNAFRIPIGDFFLNHHTELKPSLQIYTCSTDFYYQPKFLSLQLYGTTELWLALLRANGLKSICQFHYPFIKVYEPSKAIEIIKTFFKREDKM